ncbi:MAG: gliding motility protein GldN [Muribaculaceae bacterium]
MKTIKIIAVAALLLGVATGYAQEETGVVRKRNSSEARRGATTNPQVTQRMQSFYEHEPISDADLTWMRVIYRSLDLTKEKNLALYYPEESMENEENLFRMIMRLLANNEINAYEYLDGRELFTDQYRIKVRDMLDRFHVLYADAKGSTEKNPKFKIEESDVPANEVLSYYVLERWEFDRGENKMKQRVEAICPVLHRSGDFGGEAIKYPMFWVKFDVLRPYLAQQYIFTDNDNNKARFSYDDFFQLGMYSGEIYKTKNLRNMSMMQLFPDPDDMKHAQDSIEKRLRTYDKNLWVPTREELQMLAEAKALADTTMTVEEREKFVKEPKNKRASSKRGESSKKKDKKPKESKVKESKSSSSSSATRSVRRRNR